MTPKRLLYVVNDVGYFTSHRMPIALGALTKGYEVHVAYGASDFGAPQNDSPIIYHSCPLDRGGTNPIAELQSLVRLVRLFRRINPTLVHLVTLKPVLYGGIVARLCRVKSVVSAIAGFGSLLGGQSNMRLAAARCMITPLLRFALGHTNQRVIFQNSSDIEQMISLVGLNRRKAVLIRGSGVDLNLCPFTEEPSGTPVVVMASRLIRDKGVIEFLEAARILRAGGSNSRFVLIGERDPGNPSGISQSLVDAWQAEGVVEMLGHRNDVPRLFSEANIVVLPSYREGLPKTLLEASACGRAIVTTDVPGCRDAVEPGVNALLVQPQDARALAAAIQTLLENHDLRHAMGKAGRSVAEKTFAIEKVVSAHLDLYLELS